MNQHWTVRLEDVAEVNPRAPKGLEPDAAVAFVPMAAVSEDGRLGEHVTRPYSEVSKGYSYFERGDLLLAKITPCFENGKAALVENLVEQIGFGSTEFHVLRPGPDLDGRYLFYMLWNERFRTEATKAMTGSAGQKRVPADLLRRIEVRLPPLDEQRRIAAILDKADTLHQQRKRAIALLDSLTQSIFLEMFGDPVANHRGLPASTLGQLGVVMKYGPRFYNETYSNDGVRIVRITDLSATGALDFDAMPRLLLSDAELAEHRSQPGELLFARTGATVGKIALMSDQDPVCVPGAYFIRLRFPNTIHPLFAAVQMRSRAIQTIVAAKSGQSAQQNFSGPGLRQLPFLVPPMSEQAEFARRLASTAKLRGKFQFLSVASDRLFAALQHRAFSGQL